MQPRRGSIELNMDASLRGFPGYIKMMLTPDFGVGFSSSGELAHHIEFLTDYYNKLVELEKAQNAAAGS